MSLAVLTDSTTAQGSPAVSSRPRSGNSMNTSSVSSSWAWSEIPMVAVSPSTLTHSWELAYFRWVGMSAIAPFF